MKKYYEEKERQLLKAQKPRNCWNKKLKFINSILKTWELLIFYSRCTYEC